MILSSMRETVEQWLRLAGLQEWAIEASTTLVPLFGVLALAWVLDFVVRKILLRFAAALAKRTRATWDDKLLEHRALHTGAHIARALVIYALVPAVFANQPTLSAINAQGVCAAGGVVGSHRSASSVFGRLSNQTS